MHVLLFYLSHDLACGENFGSGIFPLFNYQNIQIWLVEIQQFMDGSANMLLSIDLDLIISLINSARSDVNLSKKKSLIGVVKQPALAGYGPTS